ncbi:MAG: hypothetical protein JXB07_21565 [Anaerolineae bacterium]|nr:hypothetical protein [Anaerolineae bacterium]
MIKLSDFLKGSIKVSGLTLLVLLAAALSACGAMGGGSLPTATAALPTAVGGGDVRELPTPLPAEEVGVGATSGAQDTPEGTWGNYLRDIIAEQNQAQSSKINLYERYEAPSITQQKLNTLVKAVALVSDRSKITENKEGVAVVNGDFDIRFTKANGDTETRTCKITVQIERYDSTWYVLNPQPLAIFSVCSK